eukprot:g73683.t1
MATIQTVVVAAVRARWSPQEQANVFLWFFKTVFVSRNLLLAFHVFFYRNGSELSLNTSFSAISVSVSRALLLPVNSEVNLYSCVSRAVVCRFDLFTINQHGTDNVAGAFWFVAFEANVARIGHTVLVQSPWTNPVPLTRAWCLWEILCTSSTKATFEINLPPKEEQSLLESLVTQEGEGIHGLNKVVIEQLRDWLAKTAKAAIPEEHSSNDPLSLINSVTTLLSDQGKLAEAEPLCRRALAGCEEKLGATHPDTLATVNNLANLLRDQGKLAEAEPLCRRALAGREEKLGATHPDTLATVNNLAALLSGQGKLAEAVPLYRRSLAGREEKLGATHPDTLATVKNLAILRVSLWTFPFRDA